MQDLERTLHTALTRTERERQRGTRPGFTIGKQGEDRGKRFFHRPQQQYHLALCTGLQAIAARSGVDLSNPRKVWRKRPSSTRKRARCVASGRRKRNTCAMSVSRVTSPGHASAKARSKANRIGRLASDTVVLTACTKWRQASITRTDEAKRLSMSSSSSGHESVLLFLLWSCAMGVLRNSCVLATSACSAAMPEATAASVAAASASCAALAYKRRSAMPARASA